MTKEELKDKCAERAKIFQEAMESCKSSNPVDCIEWFADKIIELEKAYNDTEELLDKQIEATYKVVKELKEEKEKLAEAKEILSRWLRLYKTNTVKGIITDTEQFLKEVKN